MSRCRRARYFLTIGLSAILLLAHVGAEIGNAESESFRHITSGALQASRSFSLESRQVQHSQYDASYNPEHEERSDGHLRPSIAYAQSTVQRGDEAEHAIVNLVAFKNGIPIKQAADGHAIGGTGVVIHSTGLILTASHVIRSTNRNCTNVDPRDPIADLIIVFVLDSDPDDPAETLVPMYAIDLRDLEKASRNDLLPAQAPEIDLVIFRINRAISGRDAPENLIELEEEVLSGTLDLEPLDEPLGLTVRPIGDIRAVDIEQDLQLSGYPSTSAGSQLLSTEGPLMQIHRDGTIVVDRAFSTYGFSGGPVVDRRSGFLVGIVCGGQPLDTPAGRFFLTRGRSFDHHSTRFFEQVPELQRHPVAEFSYKPRFPRPGEPVTLSASESFDLDGTIVSYDWDFNGDGIVDDTGVAVEHAFPEDARIKLMIRDEDGLQSSHFRRVILDQRYLLQQQQVQCQPVTVGVREFHSIQEAIDEAPTGATISVGPGVCQENLRITKGLSLEGAGLEQTTLLGDGQEPVISICPRDEAGRATCSQPTHVHIEGFSVRNGRHSLQAFANAVVIAENNSFRQSIEQGVDAAFGADMTLGNNEIRSNDEEGFVLEGGNAVLIENEVTENGDDGVLIKNLRTTFAYVPASASLQLNVIVKNSGFGGWITQSASVEIDGGTIAKNGSTGVEIDQNSYANIQRTIIEDNGGSGIQILDAEAQVSTQAVIRGNTDNGFTVRNAIVQIDNATIENNAPLGYRALFGDSGISAAGSSNIKVAHTQIRRNYFGIRAHDSAEITVVASGIVGNSEGGIQLLGHNTVHTADAILRSNGFGIETYYWSHADLTITGSIITKNDAFGSFDQFGLRIAGRATKASIRNSTISNNPGYGIIGGTQIPIVLKGNLIEGNGNCAISGSLFTGWDNEIVDEDPACYFPYRLTRSLPPEAGTKDFVRFPQDTTSVQTAIDLAADGGIIEIAPGIFEENIAIIGKSLTVRGQNCDDTELSSAEVGILILVNGNGEQHVRLSCLKLGPSAGSGIWVRGSRGTEVVLEKLHISGNGDGIAIASNPTVKIDDITISQNRGDGMSFARYSCPHVEMKDSQISINDGHGIDGGTDVGICSRMWIRSSEISDNGEEGIDLRGYHYLDIADTHILHNDRTGIEICADGHVEIVDSSIRGNGYKGIGFPDSCSRSFPDPRIEIFRSSISDNADDGVEVRENAALEIADSTITANWNGIDIRGYSDAIIERNRISGHVWCGVTSHASFIDGSENVFSDNGADLCWNAPASLRIPLTEQTDQTSVRVPSEYSTIQEAVDAVASGGTVHIAEGTYKGGVTIWKPITLQGAGTRKTVLEADSQKHLVVSLISDAGYSGILLLETIEDTQSVLRDLTVANSAGSGVWTSAAARFENIVVRDNLWDGILVWGTGGSLSFQDSDVLNNLRNGIRFATLLSLGDVELNSCDIAGNETGVAVGDYRSISISESRIIGNGNGLQFTAGWSGDTNMSSARLVNNRIAGNENCGIDLLGNYQGTISGAGNEIEHNGQANLCPEHTAPVWPEEFLTESQLVNPQVGYHTMAHDVLASSPYIPLGKSQTFSTEAEQAISWIRLLDLEESHVISWQWYTPDGDHYARSSTIATDPASEGYDYWNWYVFWASIWIYGYEAATMPGQWHVDVLFDGVPLLSETFVIQMPPGESPPESQPGHQGVSEGTGKHRM